MQPNSELVVILDIDGTLVGSALYCCPLSDKDKAVADFWIEYSATENYLYQKRPWLDEFIKTLFENFRVFVWSDNPRNHIFKLIPHIFGEFGSKIEKVFDQSHCTVVQVGFTVFDRIKPVDKVIQEIGLKCVLIDDKDVTIEHNPGRAIKIPKYDFNDETKQEDDHLKKVLDQIVRF